MANNEKAKDISLTTSVNLNVKINDNTYIYSIPAGAPFGETYDALIKSLGIVKEWIDKSHDKVQEGSSANKDKSINAKKEDK